jgi:MerC mercury resistance protein
MQFTIFVLIMRFKINWDALGITATLACAIHCALLPLFLSSLPLLGINIIRNNGFEIFMIVLAFCIGGYSLWHGYKKHHHTFLPLILFSIGFFFLVLKQFFIHYEYWLLLPAIVLIIAGHITNYKFCRIHNHAHVEDCNH